MRMLGYVTAINMAAATAALGGLGIRRTMSTGPSPLLCQRVREIATPAALDPGGT